VSISGGDETVGAVEGQYQALQEAETKLRDGCFRACPKCICEWHAPVQAIYYEEPLVVSCPVHGRMTTKDVRDLAYSDYVKEQWRRMCDGLGPDTTAIVAALANRINRAR
jgi:hypothetical protein